MKVEILSAKVLGVSLQRVTHKKQNYFNYYLASILFRVWERFVKWWRQLKLEIHKKGSVLQLINDTLVFILLIPWCLCRYTMKLKNYLAPDATAADKRLAVLWYVYSELTTMHWLISNVLSTWNAVLHWVLRCFWTKYMSFPLGCTWRLMLCIWLLEIGAERMLTRAKSLKY